MIARPDGTITPMKVLVLLAGVMLIVYGLATLVAGHSAGHSQTSPHSTAYGVTTVTAGAATIVAALVWIAV